MMLYKIFLDAREKIYTRFFRAKREISVSAIAQPRDTAETTTKNLETHKKNDHVLPEDDNAYLTVKHKISKRFANSVNTDLQPSNEKSTDYESNAASSYRVLRSNEKSDYTGEAEEETNRDEVAREKPDQDRKTGNLVRLPRDVTGKFLDKYTDQDERSSLYDEYEAKDVAKRGIPGGSEDYEEEAKDDSSVIEDVAALQEQELANEADKRETRNDARVKRDQAISAEPLADEQADLTPVNAPKLDGSKIAEEDPSSRQVSLVESIKSSDEASASDDISKTKGSESNVSPEIKEPLSAIASSADDDLNAKYEKRVEDEIQRKIDSIKEEIRRDIEAQERIRDIEENNARFDQLREHEEDEEGRNAEGEPIEKRQTVAKRSVRKGDQAAFSRTKNDKSPVEKKQRDKSQRRSREIDKSNASNENKGAKKRSMVSGQFSANGLVKKKREHDREMFLVNNDRKARKRRSKSYISDQTDVRPKNELFADRNLNSYLYTDNKMVIHTHTRIPKHIIRLLTTHYIIEN